MLPLRLGAGDFCRLIELMGPSLGLWRAAEVAALREQTYERPILDLGCGDGLVTSFVLRRIEAGLDPNRAALQKAARLGVYERLEAARAEESQLPDTSFATVLSNSVLEHLPHLDDVLRATARVLRPGGRLILTAPTEAFGGWLALPLCRYADWRNEHYDHFNLWSSDIWARHLDRAGFEVEQVRPYLRRRLVSAWDALDLLQEIRLDGRRVASAAWKRLPGPALEWLARRAAKLDLGAPEPGGGRLIVARKR